MACWMGTGYPKRVLALKSRCQLTCDCRRLAQWDRRDRWGKDRRGEKHQGLEWKRRDQSLTGRVRIPSH